MTTQAEAFVRMDALYQRAMVAGRPFDAEEQIEFDQLKGIALAAKEQPSGPLRPVGKAARTLSAAVLADGLVARMVQAGRARVEVPIDVRALGSDQALNPVPGLHVQPNHLGLSSGYRPILNRLLPALASVPVTSNAVTYTRITYSAAGGGGNKAAKVQELAAKPESVLSTEEVSQTIDTWAHWLPCSKQVLDDESGLRALLDVLLVQGLLDKTDAGVFADMTGVGRFTPYTPTADDTIGDGLARVASALVQRGAGGVKLALHPSSILAMSLVKATGSGIYLGMPPNIPGGIVSSASVPAGKVLAWADSGAVWANREGVSVVAGLNADDFTKNKITLLAEHRGSVLTLDPGHVFYGDVQEA